MWVFLDFNLPCFFAWNWGLMMKLARISGQRKKKNEWITYFWGQKDELDSCKKTQIIFLAFLSFLGNFFHLQVNFTSTCYYPFNGEKRNCISFLYNIFFWYKMINSHWNNLEQLKILAVCICEVFRLKILIQITVFVTFNF